MILVTGGKNIYNTTLKKTLTLLCNRNIFKIPSQPNVLELSYLCQGNVRRLPNIFCRLLESILTGVAH